MGVVRESRRQTQGPFPGRHSAEPEDKRGENSIRRAQPGVELSESRPGRAGGAWRWTWKRRGLTGCKHWAAARGHGRLGEPAGVARALRTRRRCRQCASRPRSGALRQADAL
eukprot:2036605-Rhodomonas_salina.4